jgi:hypothetical protein
VLFVGQLGEINNDSLELQAGLLRREAAEIEQFNEQIGEDEL